MKQRCLNPNFRQWADYGGRGIRVCERWLDFENFAADIGERPAGMRLERINNDGNYEPSNCKWATPKEQQRNQRRTRKVTIDGVEYVAADLADIAGIKTDAIVERAKRGISFEEITNPKRRVFLDGLSFGGRASGAKKQQLTHCKNGHEFTADNTHINSHGWRICRRCKADRQLKYNHR